MNATVTRKNPQTGAVERKAVAVGDPNAFAGGWSLENQAPASAPKPIVRPGAYGLSDWRSYQSLKDAALKIIDMRNQGNKDLNESSTYWNTIIRDTTPFGGKTDGMIPNAVSDARLNQLSPADQASIMAARDAAAGGNLQTIADERNYRQKMGGTAMTNVKDMYDSQQKAIQDEKDNVYRDSQAAKDEAYRRESLSLQKYNAGLGHYDERGNWTTAPDYSQVDFSEFTAKDIANAIKKIESGGNYNAKGASGESGAYQFMPATWKGYVDQYSKAHKLSMDYEMTPEKQDLIVNWKVQQLLNQGMTPDKIASVWNHGSPDYAGVVGVNKAGVKYDTPAYVDKVMKQLGINVGITGGNTITKAKLDTISARSGISVKDLKKMTNDQVNSISGNLYDKVFVGIKAMPFSNPDLDEAAKSILLGEIDPQDAYNLIIKYYPEYKEQLDKAIGIGGGASVLSGING